MSRQILKGDEIRQAVLRGVNTLADAVVCTLGPKGRNVILERNPMWPPAVTKDGVTVAKEVRDLADPWENAGAHLIREAASKTSDQAGDGTTTATLLAQVIYQKGLEALAKGANPVALKRGIDAAVAAVVEHIKAIAQPVEDDETIIRVGTISSNGERTIGELIARAMKKVGRDGVINVGESTDADTTLQVVEGMQLDRGWLAGPFITDPERLECVLKEPMILVTERKLFTMTDEMSLVFAEVGKSGRPVVVIAGDYEQPFIITLIHNKQLGQLNSLAVKAPAFGEERRVQLEDLAIVTGAYAFTENCGRPLSSLTVNDLGSADKVVAHGHDATGYTTIVGGRGDKERLEKRVELLRALIPATENELQREFLKRRLARLASGVAVIRVGAATEGELRERKDRVDDAVCATKAAVEEGIVPGGGVALLSAWPLLEEMFPQALCEDPEASDVDQGIAIVAAAIRAPIERICKNAGLDGEAIAEGVLERMEEGQEGVGFNAATENYEFLVDSGVIDPAKVVRCALQNAASVAALLLTTEAMVASFPDKK